MLHRQAAHYWISIHALLAESDDRRTVSLTRFFRFLSTLSLRRATRSKTHNRHKTTISIHALLAESDGSGLARMAPHTYFYPRSPCGERLIFSLPLVLTSLFLSTLSLRRATGAVLELQFVLGNFYPRSPCGERRTKKLSIPVPAYFYPRSPCGERREPTAFRTPHQRFLSTLSLRRATASETLVPRQYQFLSTLSLRRATLKKSPPMCTIRHFYPRSPCGERQSKIDPVQVPGYFYPRSPCGERLIHPRSCNAKSNFYPRSPCGERRECWTVLNRLLRFLSTLSLRRATRTLRQLQSALCHFYPRSPCGERPQYFF